MASMNVSLPDPMRDYVQRRIDSGHYASVSDYVRDLIRRDQGETQDVVGASGQWLQQAAGDGDVPSVNAHVPPFAARDKGNRMTRQYRVLAVILRRCPVRMVARARRGQRPAAIATCVRFP